MARSAATTALALALVLALALAPGGFAQSLRHPFGGDVRARSKFEKCLDVLEGCRLADLPRCCEKFKAASGCSAGRARPDDRWCPAALRPALPNPTQTAAPHPRQILRSLALAL